MIDRAINLYKWISCRAAAVVVTLLFVLSAVGFAFGGGSQLGGGSSDAKTVLGKAPAVANGLATLDASSKVAQTALASDTLGGYASSLTPTASKIPVRDSNGDLIGMADTGVTLKRINYASGSFFTVVTRANANGAYSVGPTASGTTVIWTALNALPTTAKYAVIIARASTFHSADADGTAGTGADICYNDANNYAYGHLYAYANKTGETTLFAQVVFVPLLNRTFKVYWNIITTTNSTHQLDVLLIGYMP